MALGRAPRRPDFRGSAGQVCVDGAALYSSKTARLAWCSYPARGGTVLIFDRKRRSVFVSRSGRHLADLWLLGVFSIRIPFGAALGSFGGPVYWSWHHGTRFCPGSLPRAVDSVTVCHDVVGLAGRTATVVDNVCGAHIGRFRSSTGTSIAVALTFVVHEFKTQTHVDIDFAVELSRPF